MQELQEMWVWSLGWEDPLKEGMATHSSILAWIIPRTEEPVGLLSIGSQRVRHDWNDWTRTHLVTKMKISFVFKKVVSFLFHFFFFSVDCHRSLDPIYQYKSAFNLFVAGWMNELPLLSPVLRTTLSYSGISCPWEQLCVLTWCSGYQVWAFLPGD